MMNKMSVFFLCCYGNFSWLEVETRMGKARHVCILTMKEGGQRPKVSVMVLDVHVRAFCCDRLKGVREFIGVKYWMTIVNISVTLRFS